MQGSQERACVCAEQAGSTPERRETDLIRINTHNLWMMSGDIFSFCSDICIPTGLIKSPKCMCVFLLF